MFPFGGGIEVYFSVSSTRDLVIIDAALFEMLPFREKIMDEHQGIQFFHKI